MIQTPPKSIWIPDCKAKKMKNVKGGEYFRKPLYIHTHRPAGLVKMCTQIRNGQNVMPGTEHDYTWVTSLSIPLICIKNKLKYHIYISFQTFYSVLSWSTFGTDNIRVFLGMTLQAWHTCILGVSPILLKLCQVGCGASLHSYFQVSPEMFYRVQVSALAGTLKDIQRIEQKHLLHCIVCVLIVVVL